MKTAVEWLVEKLDEQKFITKSQIYIAEKMEREQIIEACKKGYGSTSIFRDKLAEQYYNETFKNK
jgi:hypothetical protein